MELKTGKRYEPHFLSSALCLCPAPVIALVVIVMGNTIGVIYWIDLMDRGVLAGIDALHLDMLVCGPCIMEDAESRLRGEPWTAEDVADGFIESLGTEEDWEMVTLDDISSPGSFWLNMMQPKDPDRNTVNTADIIEEYITRRNRKGERSKMPTSDSAPNDEPGEEELARILADLESF